MTSGRRAVRRVALLGAIAVALVPALCADAYAVVARETAFYCRICDGWFNGDSYAHYQAYHARQQSAPSAPRPDPNQQAAAVFNMTMTWFNGVMKMMDSGRRPQPQEVQPEQPPPPPPPLPVYEPPPQPVYEDVANPEYEKARKLLEANRRLAGKVELVELLKVQDGEFLRIVNAGPESALDQLRVVHAMVTKAVGKPDEEAHALLEQADEVAQGKAFWVTEPLEVKGLKLPQPPNALPTRNSSIPQRVYQRVMTETAQKAEEVERHKTEVLPQAQDKVTAAAEAKNFWEKKVAEVQQAAQREPDPEKKKEIDDSVARAREALEKAQKDEEAAQKALQAATEAQQKLAEEVKKNMDKVQNGAWSDADFEAMGNDGDKK